MPYIENHANDEKNFKWKYFRRYTIYILLKHANVLEVSTYSCVEFNYHTMNEHVNLSLPRGGKVQHISD